MILERRQRIQQRAYALWEAEGQPHGMHEEHWHRAEKEVEAEESAARVKKAASPPAARQRNEASRPRRRRKSSGA